MNKRVKNIVDIIDPDKMKCIFCDNYIDITEEDVQGKIYQVICAECIKKDGLDDKDARLHIPGRGWFTS